MGSEMCIRDSDSISQTLGRFVENLNSAGKSTRQRIAMGVDWGVSIVALASACVLRLGHVDITQLWPAFLIIPIVTVLLFSGTGVYTMVIRFSGLDEMAPVVKGVIASSLALLVLLFLLHPDPNPRSLFVIYGLLLLVFCAGLRQIWRSSRNGAVSQVGVPTCLLYTSPSPRDATLSRMPSSA